MSSGISQVRANARAAAAVLANFKRVTWGPSSRPLGESPSGDLAKKLAAVQTETEFEAAINEILRELGDLATDPKIPEEQRKRAEAAIEALSATGADVQRKAATATLEAVNDLRGMRGPMRAASGSHHEGGRIVFPLKRPSEARAEAARATTTRFAAPASVTASRSRSRDQAEATRATLPKDEHNEMLRQMGVELPGESASRVRADGSIVFPLMKPSEARARAAKKGGGA